MKKSLCLVAVLISAACVFSSVGFGQRPILGGYKNIDPAGEGAVAAADFAIKTQSESAEIEYVLGGIVKAESQVVAGTNYRLCMDVSANGGDGYYVQVVVSQDLKQTYRLGSWTAVDCGPPPAPDAENTRAKSSKKPTTRGRFKPIAKTDIGAGLAADFAVKEHGKKSKTEYKLVEIVKAEDREPALMKRDFRLCLKVKSDSKTSFVQAIISVDQYSNHKLVGWAAVSKCGN